MRGKYFEEEIKMRNQAVVNIKRICGKNVVTRDDGRKIYDAITKHWKKAKNIIIDFSNLSIASVSFLDEAIGHLVFKYSIEDIVKKLSLNRIRKFDRALLNDIMASRIRQVKRDKKKAA